MHRRLPAAHVPLLPGAGQVAFIDIDSTHQRVFGRAKQGAQSGRFKGVSTLHPLLATNAERRGRGTGAGSPSADTRRCLGSFPRANMEPTRQRTGAKLAGDIPGRSRVCPGQAGWVAWDSNPQPTD
ncbi:hypothetical protein GCM10022214_76470 [Actinomadura miaoliensis]|uniref:Transposase DDE domain-containing protein n=1 Tax=Actinomadura miaoliensis TaxID=430685 RepID=A0ABP7WYF5_9ACTN